MNLMPGDKVPLNYFIHPIIESYYNINSFNTANTLVSELNNIYSAELEYYFSFPNNKIKGVQMELLKNLQFYNQLVEISTQNNHPDKQKIQQSFETFYRKFLML